MPKLRSLVKILNGLVLTLFALFALVAIASSATSVLPETHGLQGLSFVPWIYLTLFAGIVSVALLAAKRFRLVAATAVLWAVFFVTQGDWMWNKPARHDGPAAFSVVTLNLQYFKQGVETVAESIRALDADVALVSEVTLSRSQLAEFRQALGDLDFRMGKQFETAIVSRLPILWAEEVELPAHQASLSIGNRIADQPFNPRRSFMHVKIKVGEQVVNFISVRFIAGRARDKSIGENLTWGNYLLETQRREVDFLRSYVEALEGPVVFGGDLNATPSSFVVRKVNHFARDAYLDRHFLGKSTFPTYNRPGYRLDYLFHRGGLAATRAEVVPVVTSDHFPVRAEFAFAN